MYYNFVAGYQMGHKTIGGVAQWLERRSLTGKHSLIYAWSMADIWPLRG